jgi:hypothetical protein
MDSMNEKLVFLGYPFRVPGIKEAVDRAVQGHAIVRCANSELTDLQLLDKIEEMMVAADLRLFDATMHNVNVAVEFGLARGLGLAPFILYCEDQRYAPRSKDRDVFSDLRGIDSLRYQTFEDLETQLKGRIPTLLAQSHKRAQGPLPRLQMRLQEETKQDGSHWLNGEIFNAGDAPANRIKLNLAGYLLHPSVPAPRPLRIGTLVPREPGHPVTFRLEQFGMVRYATAMEHILVEFCDDNGRRYEQRGLFLATRHRDETYTFAFQGLGPLKAIERFSLPMLGLENP